MVSIAQAQGLQGLKEYLGCLGVGFHGSASNGFESTTLGPKETV